MKSQLIPIHLTLFLLFFGFASSTFSQTKTNLSAKKGRLYTVDGYEIKFRSITESDNHFIYRNNQKVPIQIEQHQVLRIEEQAGSEAWQWCKISTATGLLTSAFVLYLYERNDLSNNITASRRNKVFLIGGGGVIGGAIGLLAGSFKKKYKRIYDDSALLERIGSSKNSFRFKLGMAYRVPAICLSFKIK
ncbi:MAG: hypothetical protein AAF573_05150 [Bacteroidota bacterium]